MNNIAQIQLHNGVMVPSIAIGTSKLKTVEETYETIYSALEMGYSHLDTAQGYNNEEIIGEAIERMGIPRRKYFLTGKLDDINHSYEKTINSFNESLKKLHTDYLDVFLIHSPNSQAIKRLAQDKLNVLSETYWEDINTETWRALEYLYKCGKVRAIGGSNFYSHHLESILNVCEINPMINQIKLCVGCYARQSEIIESCKKNNIAIQGYSTLGKGNVGSIREVFDIALKYKTNPCQIALKFLIQHGFMTVIRTSSRMHLIENIKNINDYEINKYDMETLENILIDEKWAKIYNPDLLER